MQGVGNRIRSAACTLADSSTLQLTHSMGWSDSTMLSPDVVKLSTCLCDLLPASLSKAQCLNTGGEANEAAIRLAKITSGRFEVIGVTGSWHGTTSGAASATYTHVRKNYGLAIPEGYFVRLREHSKHRKTVSHKGMTYHREK